MTADLMLEVEQHDGYDLCAGPGGWDVAAQRLGLTMLGFEIDEAAILTRDANGHHTALEECEPSKAHPRGVRGLSMTEVDPRAVVAGFAVGRDASRGRGRGGIASPPCQGFSMAGKGQARADSERLLKVLADVRTLADLEAVIADAHEWMSHEGTVLVLEPLRWALAATPSWLAWEQVPAVLPLWEACAVILRRVGYSVATGYLHAEQFGVPQTRKRAILIARAPWLTAELGPVALPKPTHSKYHVRTPDRIDPGMPRWVSMAEALGWGMTARPSTTVVTGANGGGSDPMSSGSGGRAAHRRERDAGRWQDSDLVGFPRKADSDDVVTIDGEDYRARDFRAGDQPSFALTEKARSWTRHPETGERVDAFGDVANEHGAVRDLEQPSPTLTSSADNGNYRFVGRDRVNNQSGTEYDVEQQIDTPASVIATRDLVTFRGPNANRFNGSTKSRNDGIRVTVEEAAVLQSFPVDYQWQGNKTKKFQQIGNAIPPVLAEAVLCAVLDLPFDPAARECSCS